MAERIQGRRARRLQRTISDPDGVRKHLSAAGTRDHLSALRGRFETCEWSEAAIEKTLRDLAEERTLKAAVLIHGTRLAVTGRMISPGLFEMLVLLGREVVLARLDRLIATL